MLFSTLQTSEEHMAIGCRVEEIIAVEALGGAFNGVSFNFNLHVIIASNERRLDETGASEINRLYPKSRRKGSKRDKYLKSLPSRGRLEEENGRTRMKFGVRHEGEEWKSAGRGA
ncbi:hypothetical protein TNCV_1235211 [Trichonephila clavipes]|nr:hypothetical protein TNCV_1235211 [Trichonephila clavipes]